MKTRQSTASRLGLALACGFLTFATTHFSAAQSTNVTVPGVAGILLAGQPDGTSLYGDVAPINSPVAIDLSYFPGAVSLAILATGATSRDPHTNAYPLVDPDGETNLCSAPPVFDLSGLESTYCCLAGVFLVSHATLPRPSTLRFVTEEEKSFAALSPLVQQVFFIGDGLTGRGIGQLQSFTVPAGADKLYLGLFDFGGIGGGNANNVGMLTVTVTATSVGSNTPPTILSQPASRTNNAATAATFRVLAGGMPPLSYEWRKDEASLSDGGNVSGVHTATLTLSNVLGGDAGGYSVLISNAFGSVTSQVATLTVIDPVILVQPVNQNRRLGQSAMFSMSAAGTAPLRYQWWKDSVVLAQGTGSSLTLTNLQEADAGNYTAVVSNRYGSVTSAVAVLTVNPLTPCVTPPPGLAGWWTGDGHAMDIASTNHGTLWGNASFAGGLVGAAFSFDGTSSGVLIAGTASCYSCIEGGLTNVQDNFTIEFWANPAASRASTFESTGGAAGAGGQRYAVYPSWGGYGSQAGAGVSVGTNGISVFEHADYYLPSLLVWNAPVSGWTHVAVVYVNKQPRLYVNGSLVRTGLTSQRAMVYPSTFLGGSPRVPSYGIYCGLLDEVSIYDRSLTGGEIAAIWLASSAGKCVDNAPTILSQPASRTNNAGTVALFSLVASGTPPLSYQWLRGGVNLSDGGTISGTHTATLTLSNVLGATPEGIRSSVSNALGSATSLVANLAVLDPVITASRPADARTGRPPTFSVVAGGTEPLSFRWHLNGGAWWMAGTLRRDDLCANVQVARETRGATRSGPSEHAAQPR